MQKIVTAILITLLASPSLAAGTRLKTEEQKTLYGVGLVIARQLAVFNLTPAELKLVQLGIADGVSSRKPRVDFAAYSKKSMEMGIARRDARGKKLEPRAKVFLARAAQEKGAVTTKSGLVYLAVQEGTGSNPTETDKVKLHYRSTLIDGWEIDSTHKRGEPDNMPLNGYFKCLSEGVQLMKPGGKAKFVCPPETALGKEGEGVIPPNATLVFYVDLLEVSPPPEPVPSQMIH